MSEYYNVVPWYNTEEWRKVYKDVYSDTSTLQEKERALNLLRLWKTRCPSLPSGIESTLGLLEVHLEDLKSFEDTLSDNVLRLAYSSAIMRFVNHMLDTETVKGSSLYRAAKNLSVPDWIIDLRHNTAHSNTLPSIEQLREAASIGLQWLRSNYWDKHSGYIQDFVVGNSSEDCEVDQKVVDVLKLCQSLSICTHSKIRSLADIHDAEMQESIVRDVTEVFGDLDLSNLKTVSVLALVTKINSQSNRLLKFKSLSVAVKKVLLGEDSLMLSSELANHTGANDIIKNTLPHRFVNCFEILLMFLHKNDLILDFIMDLISQTESEGDESQKRKLAALWTSEILKALRRSNEFIKRLDITSNSNQQQKKRKELLQLFHHWFPNEKKCLILDLQKGSPKEFTNIHFVKPIISSFNPYLTYFVKDLLGLVQPQLPIPTVNRIYRLTKLISAPEALQSSSSKIYTINDFKETSQHLQQESSDSDCVEIADTQDTEEMPYLPPKQQQLSCGIWKLASENFSWSHCPVGILPWQQSTSTIMDIDG